MNKILISFILLFTTLSISAKKETDYMGWAIKIANYQMEHNKELAMSDFVKAPKWNYTQGLIANAMMRVYKETKDSAYLDYVKYYADYFVDEKGDIKTYKLSDYSLDKLNNGNFLFDLFDVTKNKKYLYATTTLRKQLYTQPRVSEGAFWHKKIYPHQVWLDGLYMGSPFYTRYAAIFNQPAVFQDVMTQFMVADKHTLDPKTGLNYHGWDESHTQKWADPVTGHSPNFWSRSMGWYMMAIVDVLDYYPVNRSDRAFLIKILNRLTNSLAKYQDKKTGMWYQVTNMPKRKGNYLESSGTSMFAYAIAKGVRKGYLDKKYLKIAEKAFNGIIKYSTIKNDDGTISITHCCAVAGLGGKPYRDGSFHYYISEPVRNDDPKTIGPFIMAGIELSKAEKAK